MKKTVSENETVFLFAGFRYFPVSTVNTYPFWLFLPREQT
jgi:hypothetical protein